MELLKKKVLIAESDDVVRGLLAHILQRKDFLVHTASTAEQADQLLAVEEYDAIVIAAGDGPIGGMRLVTSLAENAPHRLPRTIVTTVATSQAESLAALPLHAIVKKPVEIGDFVELVRQCVAKPLP
ncbi:MAG: response regulator [Acidobacteriota bacterium]